MSPPVAESDWFADETFWTASYNNMFSEARLAAGPAEVDQILALVQLTDGVVLDLACGPGRNAIPLVQRGFNVTAVDRSPFLLQRARDRANELGVEVEWLESDMRTFRRPAAFDLVLLLFTSFGFFRDDAENVGVLRNVAASLRPGGALVLDTMGKEVLARVFDPTASHESPDGLVIHRRRVEENWSRLENEWIIVAGGSTQTFRFGHWIYSARELTHMLIDAGFRAVDCFGNFHGASYGPEAKRLVVVARR
jgi:SAM-dependent methyltransferase